jgi:hypothetical protein
MLHGTSVQLPTATLWEIEHVFKVVELSMNFILPYGLDHHRYFLGGRNGAEENANAFKHTDGLWPSHGTVLKLFWGGFEARNINAN